jgi:hypothetical protein
VVQVVEEVVEHCRLAPLVLMVVMVARQAVVAEVVAMAQHQMLAVTVVLVVVDK